MDVERGGVTRASIKRANLLAEKYSEVIIATFVFQQFHNSIINELYDRKILSKNIRVVNFFEHIKPKRKKFKKSKNKYKYSVGEKGFFEFPVKKMKTERSYRYYKNGFYVKYKRFNEDGSLKFIDYMDYDRYRIAREEYDQRGVLVRVRQMDKLENKSRLDRYFDDKGNCYLSVHINSTNGKEGRAALFNDTPREYDKLYDLQQEWLNSLLNEVDFPVVMCELRGLDKFLLGIKHNNAKKIEVIHTNHLEEPFNDIKNIKKSYKTLFEQAKELDKVVFLTDEQKKDVEAVYGANDKFTVIPHACEPDDVKREKSYKKDYDRRLVVTLARYHKDKNLDEAIRAFTYVVEKIPDAKYYIYGNGKLENELKLLIESLGLKNNVFLKKYTTNPRETFEKAVCSILTSRQEAFAMVLTESMAVGTPVISYDIKYGPNDIIENEFNGYLVERGNKKELAEKIIKLMKNEDLREELSINASVVKETFSEEKFKKQWLELVKG